MTATVEGRRPGRILLIMLAVIGLVALVAWGALLLSGKTMVDARRELRMALGLPKIWVTSVHDDVSRHQAVPCPSPSDTIVIISGGQSNAANAYEPIAGNGPVAADAVMMWNGACYALQSPVLGASGESDSLWPALGAELARRQGRPVLFINGAVGGTQVADWLDERSGYMARLAGQIAQAEQKGYRVDRVVWIQGETDAAVKLPPETFIAELSGIRARLPIAAGKGGPVWMFVPSTRCMERPNNGPALDAALARHVAGAGAGVMLGPDASSLGNDYRRDGCHFNNYGRDRLAGEIAAMLSASLDAGRTGKAG